MPYQLSARTLYPYGPATRFAIAGVQPPAAGYLGPSDQLSLSVLSPNVAINFSLALRYLDLQGNVQPLLYEIKADATADTPFVLPIQLAEGFLLSAVAFGATVQRGQCWLQFVVLRQHSAEISVVAAVILQGYVSTTDYPNYPGTQEHTSIEGRGAIREITVAGPGAPAVAVTLTVPPGVRWQLRGVHSPISVPNDSTQPLPRIQILNGATVLSTFWAFSNVNNVTNFEESWYANATSAGDFSTSGTNGLPLDLRLPAGWTISVDAHSTNSQTWTLGTVIFIIEELVEA